MTTYVWIYLKPRPSYDHLWWIGLALFTILILNSSTAQAAEPPISLESYWQKVEQSQALVAELTDETALERRAELLALAEEWEGITQIILPDGKILPMASGFLASQLRADPPDPERLSRLLATLLEARSIWPASRHNPTDVGKLQAILARSEFQWPAEAPPSPLVQWFFQTLQRFLDFIASLWPESASTPATSTFFQYGLTFLFSLLLLLIIGFIARSVLIDLVSQAEAELDNPLEHEVLTAGMAFTRAQELSRTGDYRTAVRYLYLSSLLHLDERGLLSYNRSQTNREYLRSVAHLPPLAALLREVIEVFDRVWYGYQPLDETTYQKYAAQVAELHRQ